MIQYTTVVNTYVSNNMKGHSTTVSIKVSKTLDRGSIPRAPATKIVEHLLVFF